MTDKQMFLRIKKKIFKDWVCRGLTWQQARDKYGVSKAWFYKHRARYIRYGERAFEDSKKVKPAMANALDWQQKLSILDYVYDEPTHGPRRIADNVCFKVCPKTVWNFLKAESLNTKRKRRLWAEYQGKPVLTDKEKKHLASKHKHIEASSPGELICMDTLEIRLKNLGRVYQWSGCCAYSSYGWAKVYSNRYSDYTVDFIENHILKNVPYYRVRRILTDRGSEFCYTKDGTTNAPLARACRRQGIIHSVTKPAHPWTNGYVERLNQTIWQEFYLSRLKMPFNSLEELQVQLDQFMRYYNFSRHHTGYKLQQQGVRYPAQSFFDMRESERLVSVEI